ncbi:hypothetical protein [Sediminibacterium goheungense]|uniref:Uncharacterized protein n=1 Tax=Sediminibacterium goheungense TaxID=1086393 RepID=A0A4R6IX98_9BACT|nr:hypothetical protein [Sediminibacterium goheungense]TDO26515.1 hypothetical protein BC659_1821 [Sediminibacterium goheungense]
MEKAYRQWVSIGICNLILVALLGCIMRYKIIYSLPWLHQKHILHAHSHFAFSGWISQLLMVLLVGTLHNRMQAFVKYRYLLIANLLTAYGMLLSFPFEGYGPVSISFSTASILISYLFSYRFLRDLRQQPSPATQWFRAAVFFWVLSSLGAFTLSYLMASHTITQRWYLAAVYFFLHFQYNGWFFFGCMGILFAQLKQTRQVFAYHKRIFRCFVIACTPAYGLSVLWAALPLWVNLLVAAAAIAQVAGGIYLWKLVLQQNTAWQNRWPLLARQTGMLVMIALSSKLLLQLFSTIPSLSDLAFGFRPVVIGYLHLVLLGIISLFLITTILVYTSGTKMKWMRRGIRVFTAAIVLNELLLMLQGVCAMAYIAIPGIQQILLFAALALLTGAILIFFGYRKAVYA